MKCYICGKDIIKTQHNQKYCDKCSKKRYKIYYQKHKKEILERRKKHYQKYHQQKRVIICEMCSREIIVNSSRQKRCDDCQKIWHKVYQANYSKEYRKTKNGKLAYKKLNNKRRATKNNIVEDFTMEEWFRKVDKTLGICHSCNKFVGKEKLTIDHNPPLSKVPKGFVYTINDVNPLCKSCNSKKSNKFTITK